ncbi:MULTISPECIES: SDR family NAD(P)-dependent oxidoreductase [unclassified Simplicispira]|jgi:NAD(P)-dependent dehydrogenase (short-subunit alcohol dehydrogenase family)|uniref:SDR family NAD(P)-dependent oxidoreductase n=1 Tax=unclassified Simplicispira TaxID=2630407 RepID=UPI000D5DDAB0|nr:MULTISPECIES: SDR family NAD(P)-dependent oxidoreductase [unclassified Simplicispira]MBH1977162.1 SDR family NAD(P)-dependent oxidoreductase [Comamonadaceae bacterium]PVY57633.1 NAD(P)-dependent dehydrogenase (short-subunit alcohol dehydrogenase family) [Simplicispira sp. 125]REG18577.1 NAD(P)-dependent dehydrogenase (short-subunit alcohol dehydrogenase family) [Simplicispira sp. 110]
MALSSAPLTGRLSNRVAVVTGGASGLGAATALALRNAGARVVLLDRDTQAVQATAQALGVAGYTADVAQDEAMEAAFAQLRTEQGPVSILVNCAGVAHPGSVVRKGQAMPLAEFERVVEINLLGTINAVRCAVPQMIEARSGPTAEAGVIIHTASIAAFDGQVGQAAYAASKGGCAGMVLPLARELGDYGIRVMGIAPGVFETPMTLNLAPASRAVVFSAVPPFPQRPGQADEFAALVLAIIDNPMLNGEVIRLDGGLRMPARL